jgi:sec-independent protein translocase protein TatA
MGGLSIWHWIIVIAVVLLLFGRGKISELMGDVAQGIKAFKKGMTDDETAKAEPSQTDPVKTIDHQPASTAAGSKPAPDLQSRAATEKRFEGGTV